MPFIDREFKRLAGKAVHEFNMIQDGDRILVGLSGGKDSLAMLYFLEERRRRVPIDYSLVAVHLDMGYENRDQQEALKDYLKAQEIDHYFEETNFAPLAHSKVNRENPCFLCSRLRRRRLFELARDHSCTKVALGHHREDLIETLLLNIFYSGEISTMRPVQEFFHGLLTVIRPLCKVPEGRIHQLVDRQGLPVMPNGCPSNGKSKREEVKGIIENLSRSNDKIKGNIFRSLSNYKTDYLLPPGGRSSRGGAGLRQIRKSKIKESRKKELGDMGSEQRKRTRVDFVTTVTLIAGDRELKKMASTNLSLKGLYVKTKERLPPDTPVDVRLELSGASSRVLLKMRGKVARIDKGGMGVDFTEVDLDSFYHLRNIVLYNSDDPSIVDDEIATKPAF